MNVYVTGNVINPGSLTIPRGSSLNQAIANSGGKELLSGTLNF